MKKVLIFPILLILGVISISGCTSSNSTSTDNATFNNSFMSFQYPNGMNVSDIGDVITGKNASDTIAIMSNHKDNLGNPMEMDIIVEPKTDYQDSLTEDPSWTDKGNFTSPKGVSYNLQISDNGVVDYHFIKNGKYFELIGYINTTPEDKQLLENIIENIS